jgi:uncharacterized protein YbaR (Trm112 family)
MEVKNMTQDTWNTFLDVMKKDKNTIVLDLTKRENKEKEDLVNQFDALFYKIEDIDIQNMYLRDVLRLVPDEILKGLIEKMRREKNE